MSLRSPKPRGESFHYCSSCGSKSFDNLAGMMDGHKEPKICHHSSDSCTTNALMGFAKNFSIGVGIKLTVGILRALISRRISVIKALLPMTTRGFFKHDTIRFGMFLGSFAGIYKSVNCLLRHSLEEENQSNSFIAGCVAGLSLLALPKGDRPTIAVYIWLRAMAIVAHTATHKKWYPRTLKQFKHGDTLLMMLSACQILYGYIFEQQTLPKSYLKFLMGAGMKSKQMIDASASVAHNVPFTTEFQNYIVDVHNKIGMKPLLTQHSPTTQLVMCTAMHPGQSHFNHWISFVWNHFINYSLKFYVPLNLTSVLLFRRAQLFTKPLDVLKRVLKSCVRSAAFLSFYCGNAWATQCVLRALNMYSGLTSWIWVGVSAGSAVLLEQKNRRIELAIYCMSPATQSFYKMMRKWRYVPKIHHIDTMLFGMAMGIIMYNHQNTSHMGNYYPTLAKIMKGLFGLN